MSETVLILKTSAQGDGGVSGQLVDHFVKGLKADATERTFRVRDLNTAPVPHLSTLRLDALLSGVQAQPEQVEALHLSNELIHELSSADRVVIGLPVYNFGAPSPFKAYVDHLLRPNITFRYTGSGPEGLLRDKPVHLITTSGGAYRGADDELVVPWTRKILGFIGLRDLRVVYAENLQTGPEHRLASLNQARAELDQIVLSLKAPALAA